MEQLLHVRYDLPDLPPQEDPQVDQHLVIARTAAVDLFAGVADALRQQEFDLRVHVFDALFDRKFSGRDVPVNVFEFALHVCEVFAAEQSDGFEHARVRQRSQDIGFGKKEVHLAVAPDGELFHRLIHVVGFLPQLHLSVVFGF